MFILRNIRHPGSSASTPIQEGREILYIYRYIIIILLFFLFLTATSKYITGEPAAISTPAAGKLEPVSVYFCWYHQFQFAGYYAAEKKGFYREAGLDVTLLDRSQRKKDLSKNVIDIVMESSGRYGVSNSEVLIHRLQGKSPVVMAVIFQHSAVILLTRKETGIVSPQDLVGKRIMMEGKDRNAEIWATIHNEGVPSHLIHIVKGTFTKEDYLDGKIDGITAYITDQPYLLESKGIPVHYIRPLTYGIDFYGDCLFTSEQEVKQHPQRVKAFRAASLKGWEYAMKHPEEIIDFIIKGYGSRLTRDHLRYEAREMRKLILPDLIEIGHMNPGRWKHIADIFVKLKMAEPNYSLKGFIYDPNPVRDYTWVKWGIGITLFIALLGGLGVIILFFFNRRLQKEVDAHKQTEEKLRVAKEQAVAATQAKSEFLAKMSHEIRTPMNGVIGMASLLESTPLNSEQKEYVEAIYISGNNLLKIINNILDFTKIEAGKMEIEEEIFELKLCIEELFKLFSLKAEEKNILLRYAIDSAVPRFIKSDVTRLKQVLINLTNNAIKFVEDGEIFISVTANAKENSQVLLQFLVKDDGIGISEDKMETLFDAFSQVDSSSSRKYGGTGLGLTISKQLVELLGGNIWAESTPGKGSSFFFTIKASVSFAAAYQEQEAPKNKGFTANKRESLPWTANQLKEEDTVQEAFHILVAEDNKINQKLLVKLLTKMGYHVQVANNGFEVLQALESKYYSLILMDIQMPGMDGVETTRRIRERYKPNKKPKIIAITANVLRGDKEKYLDMGMVDYISKPINIQELKDKVRKWIQD